MMPRYNMHFIVATEDELLNIRDEADAMAHMEQLGDFTWGAANNFTMAGITALSEVILGETRAPYQLNVILQDGQTVYQWDLELCHAIADTPYHNINEAAKLWYELESQNDLMDLVGFLFEFQMICQHISGRQMYILTRSS